jgi:hypothetical protein
MVILRATLILGGQKEDKRMMYSITPLQTPLLFLVPSSRNSNKNLEETNPYKINVE